MLKVLVLIIVAIALDNLIEGAFALVSDGEESVPLEKICTSSSRNNECDIKLKMNCIVTKSDDYPNLKGMNCMDARDTLASSPHILKPWYQCRYDSDGKFINQYTVKVRYTFTICNESNEYDIKLNLKKSNVKINSAKTSLKKADVAQTLESSQCQTIRKWRRVYLCTFDEEETINSYYLSMWLTGRSQEENERKCSCYMMGRSSSALTETSQWVEVGNALEPTNRDYPWSPSALNGDGTMIALTLPWYDCWPSSAIVYSFSEAAGLWSPLGEDLLSGDDDPLSIALSSRGDRVAIVVHHYYGYDYQLRVHDYNAEEDFWLRTETIYLVSNFGSTHFLFMNHDGNRIMYSSSSVYSPGSGYKLEIQGQVYNEDTQVWSAIAPVITDSGEYPLELEDMVSNSNADRVAVLGSQILEQSSMSTEDFRTIRIYDLSSDMDKWVQVGQDINLFSIWPSAGNEYSIKSMNMSGEGNHIAIRTCSGEYVTEQDNNRLICDQDYVHVWKLKDGGSTWVPHGQEAIVGVREPQLNNDGSVMVVEMVNDYHEYIRNPLQGYGYDGNSWEPIGMRLEPQVSDEQLIFWKSMGMAYEKDSIIVLKAEGRYNTKTTFTINELKDFS